jgi:HSP20 family protein
LEDWLKAECQLVGAAGKKSHEPLIEWKSMSITRGDTAMNTNTLLRWDPISRTQWNPFKDRDELESRLATLFATRAALGDGGKEAMTVTEWSPLLDIIEDEKQFLIRAELPDMKKEQVKLTVENDVLTMSGERQYEKETTGHKHHRIERAYGRFMRSFSLPENTDGSKMSADYKDGMLTVRLPKAEKTKPKAIEVKVA